MTDTDPWADIVEPAPLAPFWADDTVTLYAGDCLDVLRGLEDCSIDAVATDPPYGLGFMGRQWDQPGKLGSTRRGPGAEPDLMAGPLGRDHTKITDRSPSMHAGRYDLSSGALFSFQVWVREWSLECFRVLKPGGHIVAFGGSRTWHRLACGIEDAGFTIRDSIAWLYASGFPKSMDVTDAVERWQAGQALDGPAIAIRDGVYEVTKFLKAARDKAGWTNRQIDELFGTNGMSGHWVSQGSQPAVPSVRQWAVLKERLGFGDAMDAAVAELASTERPEDWGSGDGQDGPFLATLGRNPDASGVGPWGTAMKPAFEPIVVGRKPPAGTLPANIQTWGTGALNIDGCRTVMSPEDRENFLKGQAAWKEHGERNGDGEHKATEVYDKYGLDSSPPNAAGRWPANVVLDPVMAAELDRVGPQSTSPAGPVSYSQPTRPSTTETVEASGERREVVAAGYGDSGGASRFFPIFRYEAKAGTRERPKIDKPGAEPDKLIGGVTRTNRQCRVCGSQTIKREAGNLPSCGHDDWEWVPSAAVDKPQQVAHPTVKPLDLMRWLVRLVTPPGGTVLEPFAGSGTTAEACVLEGMKCVAIEREADYLPLIVQRLTKPLQPALFLEGL